MDMYNLLNSHELDADSGKARYLQIADLITSYIENQIIKSGAKLPPERELAEMFKVSRTTAINAYRILEQRELIETRVGSGTYVLAQNSNPQGEAELPWSQIIPPMQQSPTANLLRDLVANVETENSISFGAGVPDPDIYPLNFFRTVENIVSAPALSHIPTEGYWPLREELVNFVRERKIAAALNQIMVVSGSQQALYLISRALVTAGDYVVVESPAYLGAIQVFENAGARLLPFSLKDFSLDLLEDYFIRYRPKCMYVNSCYQNPTGRSLSPGEQAGLNQLAKRYRVLLIEDDPYGLLSYEEQPPAPIRSLERSEGVIYISTFSKILFPGLRIGFIVANEALLDRLTMEKQLVDLHSSNLSQLYLTQYLKEGHWKAHINMVREIYKKRRDVMAEALRHYCSDLIDFSLPQGGFYIWCRIKFPVSTTALMDEGAKAGLVFVPGDAFFFHTRNQPFVRLCYVTQGEDAITEGIKRLAKALEALKRRSKEGLSPASHHPIV